MRKYKGVLQNPEKGKTGLAPIQRFEPAPDVCRGEDPRILVVVFASKYQEFADDVVQDHHQERQKDFGNHEAIESQQSPPAHVQHMGAEKQAQLLQAEGQNSGA